MSGIRGVYVNPSILDDVLSENQISYKIEGGCFIPTELH